MAVLIENINIQAAGMVEIHRTVEVRVTAEDARRKVNRWVHDYVSYMMRAETPTLVIGERALWRVPVALTASHVGRVGGVGEIDVDAISGKLDNGGDSIAQLIARAKEYVKDYPPYEPLKTVPEQYLVGKNVTALVAESSEVYTTGSEHS